LATPATPVAAEPAPAQRADARRNRKRILDAARELFADQGFETQMDQIARRAGVGVGTVYRHFPTKDDLLAALIDDRFEALAAAAAAGLENADAWAGFEGFMRSSAAMMAADRALSEAMGERPEAMRAAAERVNLPELTGALVERAKAEGGLRSEVIWEDVPGLICGMGRGMVEGRVGPLSMSWERYLAIILDGLRAPGETTLPD